MPVRFLQFLPAIFVACFGLGLSGCGSSSDAVAAPFAALEADVTGLWEYAAVPPSAQRYANEGGNFILRLRADRTYSQIVIPPGTQRGLRQDGLWRIDGSNLTLDGMIVWTPATELRWGVASQRWPLVASQLRPGQCGIVGGVTPDRSLHHELRPVSAADRRLYELIAGEI